jgi:hypothetical protein
VNHQRKLCHRLMHLRRNLFGARPRLDDVVDPNFWLEDNHDDGDISWNDDGIFEVKSTAGDTLIWMVTTSTIDWSSTSAKSSCESSRRT